MARWLRVVSWAWPPSKTTALRMIRFNYDKTTRVVCNALFCKHLKYIGTARMMNDASEKLDSFK